MANNIGAGGPLKTGSVKEGAARDTSLKSGAARVGAVRPKVAEESTEFSPFSVGAIRAGGMQSRLLKIFVVTAGLVMAASFAISSVFSGGLPNLGGPRGQAVDPSSVVATVGKQTVPRGMLVRALSAQVEQQQQMFGEKISAENYFGTEQGALTSLTNNAAVVEAAEKAGVTVSDAEVDKKIESLLDDRIQQEGGGNPAAARRALEKQFGSLQEARDSMRKEYDRDLVKQAVLADKFKQQTADADKVTEDDYKRSVTKLQLWQIELRPALPAPGVKDIEAARAKNSLDAQAKAAKLLAQLKATPTLAAFEALAAKQSDDLATRQKQGALGSRPPGELGLTPDAADTLAKSMGNLVGPLTDEMGNAFLFWVGTRQLDLPKDYAKNKTTLIKGYKDERDGEIWRKKQDEFAKAAPAQVSDEALSAYELQTKQLPGAAPQKKAAMLQDVVDRYQTGLKDVGPASLEAAAINYQLSLVYADANKNAEALAALRAAVQASPKDASLRIDLAQKQRIMGNTKMALAELANASHQMDMTPSQPGMMGGNPDDMLRNKIADEYTILKQPKLAAAERAKVKPAPRQGGMMGGNMMGNNIVGGPGGIQVMPGKAVVR